MITSSKNRGVCAGRWPPGGTVSAAPRSSIKSPPRGGCVCRPQQRWLNTHLATSNRTRVLVILPKESPFTATGEFPKIKLRQIVVATGTVMQTAILFTTRNPIKAMG